MNTSSPTKRRVLGALDPNACSPNKVRRHEGKLFASSMQQSPVKSKLFATPRQGTASPARGRPLLSSTTANLALVLSMENQGVSRAQEAEGDGMSKKRRSPSLASTASVGSSRSVSRVDGAEEGLGGEPVAKRPCLKNNRGEVQPRRAAEVCCSPTVTPATCCIDTNPSVPVPALFIINRRDRSDPPPLCLARYCLGIRQLDCG